VRTGRHNRIGVLEGHDIRIERDSRVAHLIGRGSVQVAQGSIVDTIRAEGDITLAPGVIVTGHVLSSATGSFHAGEGEAWHLRREHWFYQLPDESLQPYSPDDSRPRGSRLVALQALTHPLWKQAQLVAGRQVA
jgi:hypothetical protein